MRKIALLSTLAVAALGVMTNFILPYFPSAPQWFVGLVFWSTATLFFVPYPTYGLWLVRPQLFRSRGIYGLLFVAAIWATLIFLGNYFFGATIQEWKGKPKPPTAFHTEHGGEIFSRSPPDEYSYTVYSAVTLSVPGRFIFYPIQLLIHLTINNVSDKPQRVHGYTLEEKINEKWTALCEVGFVGKSLFAIQDLTRANQVMPNKLLDMALLNHQILPGDEVNGWSAFQCPDGLTDCGRGHLRIKILSGAGEVFTQELQGWGEGQVQPDLLDSSMVMPYKPVDLTTQPRESVMYLKNCAI